MKLLFIVSKEKYGELCELIDRIGENPEAFLGKATPIDEDMKRKIEEQLAVFESVEVAN